MRDEQHAHMCTCGKSSDMSFHCETSFMMWKFACQYVQIHSRVFVLWSGKIGFMGMRIKKYIKGGSRKRERKTNKKNHTLIKERDTCFDIEAPRSMYHTMLMFDVTSDGWNLMQIN